MDLCALQWSIILIFVIIVSGAITRLVAINCGLYKMLYIPYPAGLIMLGVFLGYCSFTTPALNNLGVLLTDADRAQALQLFLPAYVLKVVFLTDWQNSRRCCKQIFMIGFVGFLVSALVVGTFFAYMIDAPLDVEKALLLGAVVSISDPGDHFYEITHLRRIRTTLEGEALLTTALACIILKEDHAFASFAGNAHISDSMYILLPSNALIGCAVGKVCRLLLNHVKCDFKTYAFVSAATGYLLFFVSEIFLSYGILSLIFYAIVICPTKRSHDLGMDVALAQLWALLHLLVNILVCVFAGIIFARNFVVMDAPPNTILACLSLYFIVIITRVGILTITSPLWERSASEVPFWHMAAILIWSGLRSSICLVLVVSIHEPDYQRKLETYAVGMILLNQLINGTTVRPLLIGLDQMLPFKVSSMDTALQHLEDERVLTSKALHNHAILADTQWSAVEQATKIAPTFFKDNTAGSVKNDETSSMEDQRESGDENVIRKLVLQAVKVSLTKQYVADLLSTEAYQILCTAAESAYHQRVSTIRVAHLKHHWDTDSFLSKFHGSIMKRLPEKEDSAPKVYQDHWTFTLFGSIAWEWSVVVTVITHAMFLVYSITMSEMKRISSEKETITTELKKINFADFPVFVLFSWLTFFELTSEVFLYAWDGRRNHIPNIVVDASTWGMSTVQIIISIFTDIYLPTAFLKGLQLIRLLRLSRICSLFKRSLPHTAELLNQRVTGKLITGYDVGKGYVMAIEDALLVLSRVKSDSTAVNVIRDEMEKDRLQVIKELEEVALRWAVPVSTMKTRQCALGLVRRMQARAVELNLSGVLDDEEQTLINRHLVDLLVRIDSSLVVAKPWAGIDVLMQQREFRSEPEIVKTLMEHSVSWCLRPGQMLISTDEDPVGLYIVCSGLLQCNYRPSRDRLQQIAHLGLLPNCDYPRSVNFLTQQTEYIREGSVIGLAGLLTGRKSDVSIESVHNARVTFLPMAILDKHLTEDIRRNMWLSLAMRISVHLLENLPEFEGWNQLQLLARLRDSLDVDAGSASWFVNPALADRIVLYEGVVGDPMLVAVFTAPCLLPTDVTRFALTHKVMSEIREDAPTARLLVLASKDSSSLSYSVVDGEVKLEVDSEDSENADATPRSMSITYV